MRDLYAVLGVARDATDVWIKGAYRTLAKVLHPDAGGDAEQFVEVSLAYEVLSDPERRARYDRDGTIGKPPIDEVTTKALGIIEQMLTQALAQLGPDGSVYNDVVAKMRDALAESHAALVKNMDEAVATACRIRAFAWRFKAAEGKKNYLAEMLEFKAGQHDRRAVEMQKSLAWHYRAAEILADFSFAADPEPLIGYRMLGAGSLGNGPIGPGGFNPERPA